MGPKSKTPISSPAAAAEGSAKKRAKGSSSNVQLLYTNCDSGGAVFSNVYKDYFSSTILSEIQKLSAEEKLEVKNEFGHLDSEANSFVTGANAHFNRVKNTQLNLMILIICESSRGHMSLYLEKDYLLRLLFLSRPNLLII
jgi:hypothetical protein